MYGMKRQIMKKCYLGLLSLLMSSCLSIDLDIDPVIVDPPFMKRIGKDSISTGREYGIGLTHEQMYKKLQRDRDSLDLEYLNIVGNRLENFDNLKERLPLYSYIVFDKNRGTEKGVQIWMENKRVKSISYNNGESLAYWPKDALDPIFLGESSKSVAEKLIRFQRKDKYAPYFERTMLNIKTVKEAYDEELDQTKEWYFGQKISNERTNHVYIRFERGKVSNIVIHKMRKM